MTAERLFAYNVGIEVEHHVGNRGVAVETTSIDESIRAGAAFDNRKVMPMWFMWRGRYYKVRAVTYTWHTDYPAKSRVGLNEDTVVEL